MIQNYFIKALQWTYKPKIMLYATYLFNFVITAIILSIISTTTVLLWVDFKFYLYIMQIVNTSKEAYLSLVQEYPSSQFCILWKIREWRLISASCSCDVFTFSYTSGHTTSLFSQMFNYFMEWRDTTRDM